jgi:mono/diheme cytochrome c family protein
MAVTDPRIKSGDGHDDVDRSRAMRLGIILKRTILGLCFGATLSASAFAQDSARLAAGEGAWDKAGCLQCHGTTGDGGAGGEFPAGPSLRKTRLDRAALIETVSCGLPGTQMPAWLDGAYTQRPCYGFPNGPAPDGTDLMPVLSAGEIEALIDYLLATMVGH